VLVDTQDAAREKVFNTLEATLDPLREYRNGTPRHGVVLATLKLGLNCDFDRLQELANHHDTVRLMLGHSDWEDTTVYKLQTMIDLITFQN